MRPNFFAVTQEGVLDDYPATWIASFYLPQDKADFVPQLKQQFPNITVIDVISAISHIRKIMNNVILAIEFVFLFTLIAGIVVLYAVIESTQDERKQGR